ncbi:MAG: carbon-nitrogen hydrolase family protein [Bacillota bacterium]
MEQFVASAVQISASPMAVDDNMEKVISWYREVRSSRNADLIVFPETVTTGFNPGNRAGELWELVDTIPGKLTERIEKEMKRSGGYVVFPTYERGSLPGVVYNAAVLIGSEGIVGVYRKTHPFPGEKCWVTPGQEAQVFETSLGRIGMIICYDGDFPELSRLLKLKGAEIIVRPSAFLRDHGLWSLTNQARAYDNQVWVVATNSIGTDAAGYHYFGHSMIVSPHGQVVASARGVEESVEALIGPGVDPRHGKTIPLVDHVGDLNSRVLSELAGIYGQMKD